MPTTYSRSQEEAHLGQSTVIHRKGRLCQNDLKAAAGLLAAHNLGRARNDDRMAGLLPAVLDGPPQHLADAV